jgi:hypothetical protein
LRVARGETLRSPLLRTGDIITGCARRIRLSGRGKEGNESDTERPIRFNYERAQFLYLRAVAQHLPF